jgi:uncharacterized protein YjiS (DUF1127 family)
MISHVNSSCPPAAAARVPAGLLGRILRWRNAARTRRVLLELDDHLLRDIGITRSEIVSLPHAEEWRRPAPRRLTPVSAMILTLLVVAGSLAATMIAGRKEPARPLEIASCALFEAHCISGKIRPVAHFGH